MLARPLLNYTAPFAREITWKKEKLLKFYLNFQMPVRISFKLTRQLYRGLLKRHRGLY